MGGGSADSGGAIGGGREDTDNCENVCSDDAEGCEYVCTGAGVVATDVVDEGCWVAFHFLYAGFIFVTPLTVRNFWGVPFCCCGGGLWRPW